MRSPLAIAKPTSIRASPPRRPWPTRWESAGLRPAYRKHRRGLVRRSGHRLDEHSSRFPVGYRPRWLYDSGQQKRLPDWRKNSDQFLKYAGFMSSSEILGCTIIFGIAHTGASDSMGSVNMANVSSSAFQKAEGAVADRESRRKRETARLDIDQQLFPALRACAQRP